MSWRPNCGIEVAVARAAMVQTARDFFHARRVLEVTTPVLGCTTTNDPNIESLRTRTVHGEAYLQTSPEHFMKRLLAAGYPDIFQIGPVFRDAESGRRHLPEFTMIEWYRRDFGLRDMMQETAAFIGELLPGIELAPARYASYRELFATVLELDPLLADATELAAATGADERLAAALGANKDAWLDLAMSEHIATCFDSHRLTVVFHYPRSQAALARICPHDELVADRFEIYLGPLELANGFVELSDPLVQRERFEKDRQRRAESGLPVHTGDESLIAALESGLPPCAGVAVGLERLLMLKMGAKDVHDIITFTPGKRPDD